MNTLPFMILGVFLIVLGFGVTLVFWLPRPVDKLKLKEMLGKRYPLIYVVYFANGPLLLIMGLFLVWFDLSAK